MSYAHGQVLVEGIRSRDETRSKVLMVDTRALNPAAEVRPLPLEPSDRGRRGALVSIGVAWTLSTVW